MILRLNKLFLSLACLVLCSVVLLSYQYVFPYADDWSYSALVAQKGLIGNQIHYYLHHHGRYFSNFLISLNPMLFEGYSFYRIITFLFGPATLFFSLVFFFKTYFNHQKWFLSTISLTIFASELPGISPAFYWYPTVVHYTLGSSLTIIYFSFLPYYIKEQSIKNILISIILVAMVIGSCEVVMLISDMLIFLLTMVVFIKKPALRKVFSTQLLLHVLFSLVVLLSPGIDKVTSVSEKSKNISITIFGSLDHSLLTIRSWNGKYTFILFSILIISYLWKYREKINKFEIIKNSFYFNPFFYTVILFLFYWFSYVPFFWGVGFPPRPRYENVPYAFYFCIHIFLTVVVHIWLLKFKKYQELLKTVFARRWSYLLISILLIISLTQKRTYKDCRKQYWNGDMAAFSIQMNSQFEKIRNGAALSDLALISNRPYCIVPYPVRFNKWINAEEYIDYLGYKNQIQKERL